MIMAKHLSWKVEGNYDYSSTQVNLESTLASRIMGWGESNIPDEDLYTDDDDKGRENNPHVTLLYGIVSQEPNEVIELLSNEKGAVKAKLGKVSLFENSDDYDVVKIGVESEDLARLHGKIADNIENESDFPEYKPHVTIAYVTRGSGNLYSGSSKFEGTEMSFDEVVFSSPDGERTLIALKQSVAATLNWRT